MILSRLDTIPQRDRQTDGRRTELLYQLRASALLSRGKNCLSVSLTASRRRSITEQFKRTNLV